MRPRLIRVIQCLFTCPVAGNLSTRMTAGQSSGLSERPFSPVSNRLALGTAQFGLPYGIANTRGQMGQEEAAAVLRVAAAAGIDTLDTAISYGESEVMLGRIGVSGWKVISKLPGLGTNSDPQSWVSEAVSASLGRVGISQFHGLLLHRPKDLFGPAGSALLEAIGNAKDQGFTAKVGVSVYRPEELESIWRVFRPDLVQFPLSILDRRFITSGWLSRLAAEGVETHARSVFLQGLLLMDSGRRPPTFRRWQPLWQRWEDWLVEASIGPLRACLGFALAHSELDRILVGVDGLTQLEELLSGVDGLPIYPPDNLVSEDPDLLNPSNWKRS